MGYIQEQYQQILFTDKRGETRLFIRSGRVKLETVGLEYYVEKKKNAQRAAGIYTEEKEKQKEIKKSKGVDIIRRQRKCIYSSNC